jgi:hypothetical protein
MKRISGCGDGDGSADRAGRGGRSWRAELYQGARGGASRHLRARSTGVIGGAQLDYNWQVGSLVLEL